MKTYEYTATGATIEVADGVFIEGDSWRLVKKTSRKGAKKDPEKDSEQKDSADEK